MSKLLILCTALIMAYGLSSCTRCATCYKYPEPSVKICEKDFGSKSSYDEAFRALQIDGYQCQYQNK